jgi:endogenous inhibitor of DNA gyrase (YacG/DUF329 family)
MNNDINSGKKNCPICNKNIVAEFTPFCSKRCMDVDLSRWFRGVYAVPLTEENTSPDDENMQGENYS